MSDIINRRKLPIGGVQTFSTVRKEYDVYVDKTMHIYNMASRYKAVFLARPRRFGKSLLCSTIASLFRGEKEYFSDLAISQTNWEWKAHPIIHLDLSAGNYTENGLEVLKTKLNDQLKKCMENYSVNIEFTEHAPINFDRLIIRLCEKAGSAVVVIDEYDNPLFNTVNNPELNIKLREELKGFYSVIKQNEQYLRFALITGITKFTQVSLFSGLNQPKDISMLSEYCDICGVTQKELEEYFAPEIECFAEKYGGRENYLNRIKEYYNGYCFSEEKKSVYNTYGLLNHFDNSAKFTPYWSMSGAPSFLLKYIEASGTGILEIEEADMEADNFGDYKDNTITLIPLFYQTGYLTISDYDPETGYYKLNYPNIEVRRTLAKFLSDSYSNADTTLRGSALIKFVQSLLDGNIESFMTLLKGYLQKVDYSLSSKISEYYFEFVVSNIINMLGVVCINEVHTANGRIDSVIFAGDYIYILEFKLDKPVEDALWQIEDKDYASIYSDRKKKIIKAGIVFSRETRNIVEWKCG